MYVLLVIDEDSRDVLKLVLDCGLRPFVEQRAQPRVEFRLYVRQPNELEAEHLEIRGSGCFDFLGGPGPHGTSLTDWG